MPVCSADPAKGGARAMLARTTRATMSTRVMVGLLFEALDLAPRNHHNESVSQSQPTRARQLPHPRSGWFHPDPNGWEYGRAHARHDLIMGSRRLARTRTPYGDRYGLFQGDDATTGNVVGRAGRG